MTGPSDATGPSPAAGPPAAPGAPGRPLVATYRVQLTPSFGFDAVAGIVPDLARLGISHVYLSPVAEAVTGSTHGYDVVDPSTVRSELGGRDALHRLATAVRRHGLGVVVDIVPNHVAISEPERNPWWWAMLRDGRRAPEADWFDVDWEHADGRVILPVLGAPLAEILANGELSIDDGVLRYHDRTFPLRGDPGEPAGGGEPIGAVVDRQHYRLQHWRDPERNVRRFFTIDDLVAIRPESPAVATAVHAIVADLAGADLLDGVRVDHVDGLVDPLGYLRLLRATVGGRCWIGVEKIVVGDERVPDEWPVQGTTGYEWIRIVDHLFTHPSGEAPLTRLWQDATGDTLPYHEHEQDGVRAVLHAALRPDLERVARTAEREAPGVDPIELLDAIAELTVALGRYRTYLGADGEPAADIALVRRAADAAAQRLDPGGQRALRALVDTIASGGETARRWQQLSGPALAKGGEDRALYRSLRLAAHNEVGGDPGRWTLPLEDFHTHNEAVAARWPATLLAASTHDTKRSEDVRARLLALAEDGERWASMVTAWRRALPTGDEAPAPSEAATLLAFQTAVGAWPIDAGRLGNYLIKAAREAAIETTWADPDDGYEGALERLADRVTSGPLAGEIGGFVEQIEPAARHVALAQVVLRCTAPGVPDVYQGGEAWLHTLVDPDNRGELDPDRLRAAADAAATATAVWDASPAKPAVLGRALAVRRRSPEAFGPGSRYDPLTAAGTHGDHVIAFARAAPGAGDAAVVTIASRFPSSRPAGWLDTTIDLPPGEWHDALDGRRAAASGTVALADLLGDRPAALLTPTPKF